jgi:hypothetical protein
MQGEHDNGNNLAVVDLVRELARVCNDRAVVFNPESAGL